MFILFTNGNFSQSAGKTMMSPMTMMIVPENPVQNDCGILMNAVLTLRMKVKRMTETPSEAVITRGRYLLCPSPIEPPTMTGRSEIVHGARAVSAPARNDMRKSIMDIVYAKTARMMCKVRF